MNFTELIFLDFDGAYWPRSSGNSRMMNEFAAFVLEESSRAVVISSNWRFTHSLDELGGYFPQEIEHRILGTLALEDDRNPGTRQDLIERYISQFSKTRQMTGLAGGVKFVAIDDTASLFKPNWSHLVLTDYSEGLTEITLEKVRDNFRNQ